MNYDVKEFYNRFNSLVNDDYWESISRINHRINISINEYFSKLNALFALLPMTTRMISSPGAVYGKEAIDYTSDTCPITIKWFDLEREAFLSESSQIYLELMLLQKNVEQVYSIYNSFRKENADPTHLSEFHHVEYEGNVSFEKNIEIAFEMLKKIIADLLKYNLEDLKVFLTKEKIKGLHKVSQQKELKIITFKKALDKLYEDTKEEKYKTISLRNFGSWEEIRLTEIYGTILGIKNFPLLEVSFYHAQVDGSNPKVAMNLDIIWSGYREVLGSGHRVRNTEELEEKAIIFNLPREDYKSYINSRQFKSYKPSSGFGLGWERLLQAVLEMPFIWSASHFPRVDKTLKP